MRYLSFGQLLALHLVQRGQVGLLQEIQGQCGEQVDWQFLDQLGCVHFFAQLWVKNMYSLFG